MLCKTWKDDFDVYKLCMMCMKDFAMTLVLWFPSSLQAVKVAIFLCCCLATLIFGGVEEKACWRLYNTAIRFKTQATCKEISLGLIK